MSWATSRPEVSKIASLKGLGCSGGVFILLKYGGLLKVLLFWRLLSCSFLGLALGRQVWGVPVGSRAARAAGRGWQECHDPCGSTLLLPGPAGDHWEPLILSSFAIYCLYSLSKSLSECLSTCWLNLLYLKIWVSLQRKAYITWQILTKKPLKSDNKELFHMNMIWKYIRNFNIIHVAVRLPEITLIW